MIKLKDLLGEKFASKAQQRYMFANNPTAAKKLAGKMTPKDYKNLPDKVGDDSLNEKGTRCWKGYEKKGMKTMFGKRYPNCVKKEEIEQQEPDNLFRQGDGMDVRKEVDEDLRAWFGKGGKGGAGGGGWDRYNTKGERIGKCGDRKKGEGKPKCLSKDAAKKLRAKGGKEAIAAAVRKKRRKDKNPNRRGKAKNVSSKTRKSKKK